MNADQGIYVQDSWTLGRFTLNPGVRFEHFNSSIDARDLGAGTLRAGPAFRPSATTCRTGMTSRRGSASRGTSQGNGKTAVKFGIGQVRARLQHRLRRDLRSELLQRRRRLTWNDLNGTTSRRARAAASIVTAGCEIDFSTLAGELRRQADSELRPRTSSGRIRSRPTSACSARSMPGTSVTFSYFRRDYKDLIWTRQPR